MSSVSQWFLSRSRSMKRLITLSVDLIAIVIALWMAFSLRYSELYLPPQEQFWIFALAPITAIPVFIRFGLYRAVVRYIGLHALATIFQAVALYTVLFATMILISGSLAGVVPRTVYGINALILLLFVGGSRLVARWWFSDLQNNKQFDVSLNRRIPPVIIYGAGASGVQLATALKSKNQQRPVAFIDDAKQLHNQQVDDLTVYPFSRLNHLIEKFYVQEVLLAIPSISRARRNEIIELLEPYPIHIKTLPRLSDIAEGKVTTSDIQEVDIADLLGREQVTPMQNLLTANINNKAVMVTGAGGSIGTELCRQIAQIRPKILVLFELNEFALYAIEKELKQHHATLAVMAVLGSVQNQQRLEVICRRFSIDTIYHAAAYKHVPLVEQNASEGISNNIFGTLSCAKAALAANVETFVLISTDKAVRPTNTMGASKRFAELVLQGLAADKQNSTTRFTMVRFGNVLGSSGSVVPLFREQIENGGPVTVTDTRIIRYFMTIPEAAELVIQAGAMGKGGDVFVLDMGSPVKILDLAKRMIHLSGFIEKDDDHPEGDIEIIFTGLRSGEKLYEELLIGDNVTATEHSKISRAQELVINWQQLSKILEQLERLNNKNDCQGVRQLLLKHIEGFQPQCEVQDWLG
ncbi:MAG: polysaccharide biosynthesis protein [Piscirickettsiaceae bacterium]|nr:polysaccharide biosynthesis protein [Piscirickettsiaceae bacterium]